MTIIGYARTSTADQQAGLADQIAQLEKEGCERIWSEHASAISGPRSELKAALMWVREGDTFVVTRPDRLARSVRDMLALIDDLKKRDVNVRILSIGADTTSATGKLILTVLAGVAEMEREIMLERQRAGIARAKSEGKYKGRKPKVDPIAAARLKADGVSVAEIARRQGVNASNVWRALKAAAPA